MKIKSARLNKAEGKRQKIISPDKFLSDTKNYKHHSEAIYTNRLLNKSIELAQSSNPSSTEIGSASCYINSDKFLSNTKNYEYHPEAFYTSRSLDDPIEQAQSSDQSLTSYYFNDNN
nr:14557_t:CDS:2 [Entrophospora candida]